MPLARADEVIEYGPVAQPVLSYRPASGNLKRSALH